MQQKNYTVIKNSFFNSYKSFINFIELTQEKNSMCAILILKGKTINKDLNIINIVIRNTNNNEKAFSEFSSNIILPITEINNLINDIRNDFKNNHYISYSGVNPRTNIQTIQNTRFSLNIKLDTPKELEEALEFNNIINNSKLKVLTKI